MTGRTALSSNGRIGSPYPTKATLLSVSSSPIQKRDDRMRPPTNKEKPMMKRKWQSVTFLILSSVSVAQAQNVKITPVGARTGDFCGTDRAMVFEDPTGVRILYDPG